MGWLRHVRSVKMATLAIGAATVPAAAEDRWSAVAVSSEAYGWSRNAPSKSEATQRALEACNTRSRSERCEATTFTAAECGAIAGWSFVERGFRRFGHAAAIGATRRLAEAQAMADCRRRNRGCRLATSFCNQ